MFDKNIPLINNYKTAKKYYFELMEIGDSQLIGDRRNGSDISSAISRAKKATGFDYACRATADGVRVWRIK